MERDIAYCEDNKVTRNQKWGVHLVEIASVDDSMRQGPRRPIQPLPLIK